jgi:glucosamine--fructose-6-phosphate aminotransferase (isomerizing)
LQPVGLSPWTKALGPLAISVSGWIKASHPFFKTARDLQRKNARVFMTDYEPQGDSGLAVLAPDHPETEAVCLIQSFYALTVRLAQCLGANVDLSRNLQKTTLTK